MEQLNKVELRGAVGTSWVTDVSGKKLLHFTVATNYVYRDKEGCPVIETTWHNVVYWGNLELKKGDKVVVVGRIRNTRYTDSEGREHYSTEVLANNVEVIDCRESWDFETLKKKHCSFDVYFTPIVNVEYDVEDENNLTEDEQEKIIEIAVNKAKSDIDGYLCLNENVEKIETYEVDGKVVK